MSENERAHRLGLLLISDFPRKLQVDWVRELGSAQLLFQKAREEPHSTFFSPLKLEQRIALGNGPDWRRVEAQLEMARMLGCRIIAHDEADYPAAFHPLSNKPPVIFMRGEKSLLDKPSLGFVGTRRPDAYGKSMALWSAEAIAVQKLCLISGLAAGIDALGHKAALSVKGLTAAVTGTGLDRPYPPENVRLQEEIAEKGLLISESAFGKPPVRGCFPARNRLIAALSRALLVVQAPARSGALITAQHAFRLGIPVLCFPADLGRIPSQGSNALLSRGAMGVQTPSQIVQLVLASQGNIRHNETAQIELSLKPPASQEKPPESIASQSRRARLRVPRHTGLDKHPRKTLTSEEEALLSQLSKGTCPTQQLAESLDIPAAAFSRALTRLEIRGLVQRLPQGGISLSESPIAYETQIT